jgi:hypothetical protein
MDHVGIVVDDLAAATEFFVELGLELQGEAPVEGRWVDRVVGLDGVRAEIAVVQTPDGHGRLELTTFHTPSSQDDNRAGALRGQLPALLRVEWEAGIRSLYDGMVRIVVTPTWAKLIDFETTLPSAIEELARQRDERQRA